MGVTDAALIDRSKLNDARWAACNMQYDDDGVPTMQKASEAAERAVAAYLGIEWEDFEEELRS